MVNQIYLIVENNVVTNTCLWDGNPNTWQPPADATMLIQDITPAMVWEPDSTYTTWVLTEVIGAGKIGFIWDNSILTTNEVKPDVPPIPYPPAQPKTTGTTTA
jgi:hypothetical protein